MQFQRGSIGTFFKGDPTIQRLYTFDGNLIDYSGHYNGSGAVSGYLPSKFPKLSAWFNNDESKYITCGNTSELGFVPKSFLFWFIKGTNEKSTGVYSIFYKGAYGTGIAVMNSTANYTLRYYIWTSSSTTYTLESTKTVKDGKWHCCACVNNGTKTYLYLDGILDAVSTGGAEYHFNNQDPTIGRYPSSDDNSAFDGKIGEFAIFSRALSSQEIFRYYKWATGVAKRKYTFETIQPNFFPFF